MKRFKQPCSVWVYAFAYVESVCVWDSLFFLKLNCTASQCYSESEKAGVRSEGWTNRAQDTGRDSGRVWFAKAVQALRDQADVYVSAAQGGAGNGEENHLLRWDKRGNSWLDKVEKRKICLSCSQLGVLRGLSGCWEDHCSLCQSIQMYLCTVCFYIFGHP